MASAVGMASWRRRMGGGRRGDQSVNMVISGMKLATALRIKWRRENRAAYAETTPLSRIFNSFRHVGIASWRNNAAISIAYVACRRR